jgi:hypothetical protein
MRYKSSAYEETTLPKARKRPTLVSWWGHDRNGAVVRMANRVSSKEREIIARHRRIDRTPAQEVEGRRLTGAYR